MTEEDFEGSLILEKLASLGLVDDFFEAVDSDDLSEVISLLEQAEIDEDSIRVVIKKLESFGDHDE